MQSQLPTRAEFYARLIGQIDLTQPLPNGKTLYRYQQEGVRWILRRLVEFEPAGHKDCLKLLRLIGGDQAVAMQEKLQKNRVNPYYLGAIAAFEMGTGKTNLGLATALIYQKLGIQTIVLCPASLRPGWVRECEDIGLNAEVYTWDLAPLDVNKPFFILAEEAHALQTLTSDRTRRALPLTFHPNCFGFLGLTGTPMKNDRPINIYALLMACRHPITVLKGYYEERYCNKRRVRRRGHWVWDVNGNSNLGELRQQIQSVVIRKTKPECLPDLPPKIRMLRPVEFSKEAEREYHTFVKAALDDYAERDFSEETTTLAMYGKFRQAASLGKIETAVKLAEESLTEGQQIGIYTDFVETAERIYQTLSKKYPCEILTGKTPKKNIEPAKARYQAGESKVFVLTNQAGGVGHNLDAGKVVIMVDRPLTPGQVAQSEDRHHRATTNDTVWVYWLQYEPVDRRIDAMLDRKQEAISELLDGTRERMTTYRPADVARQLLPNLIRTTVGFMENQGESNDCN